VALPLASRWYPPEYQGLAMGIAGAGNSGTVLATLFAPRLAEAFGWRCVFGLAAIPILACLVLFTLLARESPNRPSPEPVRKQFAIFREKDLLSFCYMYAITFGGFVGLASFLTVFYHDQYGLEKVRAGDFATICIIAGSFVRPVGGFLADRLGGARVLTRLYLGAAAMLALLSFLPPFWLAMPLVFVLMAMLGAGNGAVFQIVPLRFRARLGVATGIIGAAGGLGGFFLPSWLGYTRDVTGSYGTGLAILACIAMGGATLLFKVRPSWQSGFLQPSASAGAGS
jgi:NNP family nitrate/nitrite transporter-like MFS transporter